MAFVGGVTADVLNPLGPFAGYIALVSLGLAVLLMLAILFKLSKAGITIIMIEHIMHAIMRFSERVICLDAGKLIAEGAPTEVVKNPDVQRAYLGA